MVGLALLASPWSGDSLRADDELPANPAAATPDASKPAAAEFAETAPAELMRLARERLGKYRTIETDLVQTSYFDKRRLEAKGHYVQGKDLELRLEFDIDVGKTTGSLLQVCDGEELYTQYQIGDETRVTLRNVRKIFDLARANGLTGERLMITELGLGGLPAMIAGIEKTNAFEPVRVETVGGTRLYVVEGTWTDAARQSLDANADGNQAIAAYVPDRVQIYLDEQLFPRLIKYLRSADGNVQQKLVTLEFRNTTLNGPVDESQFVFKPPKGVFLKDVTGEYIRKLQAVPAGPTPGPPPQ